MNAQKVINSGISRRAPGARALYSSRYTDTPPSLTAGSEVVRLLDKPFRKAEMAQKVRPVLDKAG